MKELNNFRDKKQISAHISAHMYPHDFSFEKANSEYSESNFIQCRFPEYHKNPRHYDTYSLI